MRLTYSLMDPTGNITALVTSPVPISEQPALAARVMRCEPSVEQVGFFSVADECLPSLRMAGGEFCGNAAMSAAALHAMALGGSGGAVTVRVSGAEKPVTVHWRKNDGESYSARLEMPKPLSILEEAMPDGRRLPVVRFPGIAHVIVEKAPDRERAGAVAPALCGFLKAEALGLMFLDAEDHSLTPLVYVPGAGTLYWENSCASGTSAAGAYLAEKAGAAVKLGLRQPGGVLTVEAEPKRAPILSGRVRRIKSGFLDV